MGEICFTAVRTRRWRDRWLPIGRGHAAYDLWGHTLGIARRIAVEVESGCVRVSDSTYASLTDVDGFEPCPTIDTPAYRIIRTWSRATVEHASVEAATREETEPAHPNCIVVYERLNAIASLALYPDPRLPAETAFALTGLYLHRP